MDERACDPPAVLGFRTAVSRAGSARAGQPALVAGRRVLDFAAGGGIAAIACARAGAAVVEAAEIDDLARAAIRLNASVNDGGADRI